MEVFLLIFITLLQLADTLQKQHQGHCDLSHALRELGAVTVLIALAIATSKTFPLARDIGKKSHGSHHELGVTFRQSVCHKTQAFKMIDHSMEEFGLEMIRKSKEDGKTKTHQWSMREN